MPFPRSACIHTGDPLEQFPDSRPCKTLDPHSRKMSPPCSASPRIRFFHDYKKVTFIRPKRSAISFQLSAIYNPQSAIIHCQSAIKNPQSQFSSFPALYSLLSALFSSIRFSFRFQITNIFVGWNGISRNFKQNLI